MDNWNDYDGEEDAAEEGGAAKQRSIDEQTLRCCVISCLIRLRLNYAKVLQK